MSEATPIRLLYVSINKDLVMIVNDHLQRHGYDIDNVDNSSGLSAERLRTYQLALIDKDADLCDDERSIEQIASELSCKLGLPTIIIYNTLPEPQETRYLCDEQNIDYILKDPAGHYLELLPILVAQVMKRYELSLENEVTLRALQRRNRDLTLLTRVGQDLTATHDAQVIVERLLQAVTETIGAEGASVWLWDKTGKGPLICQSVYHQEFDQQLLNLSVPLDQGVVGWVAGTGKSAIVLSPQNDTRFTPSIDAQSGFTTTSILAIPLILQEDVIGVLELVNKLSGEFNDEDCTLLETLAASAAIAIDNARLVKALRENTAELEQKNEDLDAFAHTVAHDLKNPLGLISGTAQVLEAEYDILDQETMRHHLKVIARNSQNATVLVEELLLLAEIRDREVYAEPLVMKQILNDVLRQLSETYDVAAAEISYPDIWPVALGYGPWVEDVWLNLMSNGLKYGGTPPCLDLGADMISNTQVQFWLKDNGNGLNPAQQMQIFKPFKRFNHNQVAGHGLGLSIVQRIIEKLGGQISVESPGLPGRGVGFALRYLPKELWDEFTHLQSRLPISQAKSRYS